MILSRTIRAMKYSLDRYYLVLKVLLGLLMGLMIIPVFMQILSRYTPAIPRFIWTEEVARFCFVWIVMIGSMIAVRDDSHFNVDLLPQPENDHQRGFSRLIVHGAMALLAAVFAWYGVAFAQFGFKQSSEMWGINMLSIYVSFPLAGLTWLAFLVEKIVQDLQLLFSRTRTDDAPDAPESSDGKSDESR